MNNIDKIMYYVKFISTKPIEFDDKVIDATPKKVRIGSHFFHTDDCVSCGKCCIPEWNVFTQSEYDKMQTMSEDYFEKYPLPKQNYTELVNGIEESEHIVNGKTIKLYTFKGPKNPMQIPGTPKAKDKCYWMFHDENSDTYRCGIHPCRSITCAMPHLRWFYNQNSRTLSLSESQYGRNWAIGCPIEFKEPTKEEFDYCKENRIEKLVWLDTVAKDLNVDTWLERFIDIVKDITFDNYKQYLGKVVIDFEEKHLPLKEKLNECINHR